MSEGRPVGRNFQRGVRRLALRVAHLTKRGAIAAGGLGSPGVFDAKSRILAISRHFILTFGKFCFSKRILQDFHTILDLKRHSLNKTATLIVPNCFQGWEGGSYEPLEPPPPPPPPAFFFFFYFYFIFQKNLKKKNSF